MNLFLRAAFSSRGRVGEEPLRAESQRVRRRGKAEWNRTDPVGAAVRSHRRGHLLLMMHLAASPSASNLPAISSPSVWPSVMIRRGTSVSLGWALRRSRARARQQLRSAEGSAGVAEAIPSSLRPPVVFFFPTDSCVYVAQWAVTRCDTKQMRRQVRPS